MTGHNFQAKINLFENERGLTSVELIVLMIILALLSTLAIPRFIDLELCTKQEAIEKGISGLNGCEKLVRAQQIISISGLVQRIIPKADLSLGLRSGPDSLLSLNREKHLQRKGVAGPTCPLQIV